MQLPQKIGAVKWSPRHGKLRQGASQDLGGEPQIWHLHCCEQGQEEL